ncbi:MAG: 50S ribosomal protein L29 [Patescibacteria group bacterium]|jgi:large subunit ribosomal protein L29
MIKLEEFRKKTKEELKKEITSLEKEVQKVVSDILQKKEKNVKKASQIRRDIARIKTLLSEKLKEEKGASKK